jgi:hypothetical protein
VVAHRDHLAVAIKYRAGLIAPLFDVGRKRGPPQRGAHLLGNGVEEILEYFEFDRIAGHVAQFTTSRWSFVIGRRSRSSHLQRSQDHLHVVIPRAALFFAMEGSQSSRPRRVSLILFGRLPNPAQPTADDNLSARKSHSKLQNSIDTSFTVPQYLVSERPLVLFIGLVFQATGPGVQSRKGNRSTEDPSMATKKKAKKKKH